MRAIVSAAAAGIGHAIARRFMEAGWRVHICDIDGDAIDRAKPALNGVSATIADVGRPADVDRLFADAVAALGGIDVLVNNAGIGGARGPLETIEDADWDECIRINLSGAFYMMKRAAPLMKTQRSGCIINISTTSARTGLPNRMPYVASKVGLIGLTQNAARELGPWNIRCNAILPGAIDNERGRSLITRFARERGLSETDARAQKLSYISMRTLIDPSEVAEAALFLAGSGGRHISGQLLGVCGNAEWEA